jgi:hypothetical protein
MDSQEHQDRPVLLVQLVLRAFRVSLEPKVNKVRRELWLTRVTPVLQDHKVSLVLLVRQGHQVPQDRLDLVVTQDTPDQLDQLDPLDHRDQLAIPVHQDSRVLLDCLEHRVTLDRLEHRVNLVRLATLEQRVKLVMLDNRVLLVFRVLPEAQELQAQMVFRVW